MDELENHNLLSSLSLLSKASSHAVSVERKSGSENMYKQYLYIETSIEDEFKNKLNDLANDEILFLCGSSGDGKSEILTRYSTNNKYDSIDFHLDATHSFRPKQTAIQALDERFKESSSSKRPLVMGINIGMLGNYAQEGSDEYSEIKNSIKAFIDSDYDRVSKLYFFINFEDHPKFKFLEEGYTSDFVKPFLKRLTTNSNENPFYTLLQKEIDENGGHSKLTTNFLLLSLPEIQDTLIKILLKARLIRDQFLTARSLLDFTYQILTRSEYIFDNLFSGEGNELLERMKDFDPVNSRTKEIDQFILRFDLDIKDQAFELFKKQLQGLGIYELPNAFSYIRLSYLLGNNDLGIKFRTTLNTSLKDSLLDSYSTIWRLHKSFKGVGKQKRQLNKFYKENLISAIHKYINRNSPNLAKDEFFLAEYNNHIIATSLEVKPNFSAIENDDYTKISFFNMYLTIDNQPLESIAITANLISLMLKIIKGYRPNKHDKNAVLLLDEITTKIISIAKNSNTLLIINEKQQYKLTNEGDEYYEVSGL